MIDALALSAAAFMSLAGECGAGIAPETLRAIAQTESGPIRNPLAVNINSKDGKGGGTVRGIKNKKDAIASARAAITAGKTVDAGVTQINSKNWNWLGLNIETVFDPCQNISAQARLLKSYSKYNTGDDTRGFRNGYVQKVLNEQTKIRNENINLEIIDATQEKEIECDQAAQWDIEENGRCRLPIVGKRKIRRIVIEEYP